MKIGFIGLGKMGREMVLNLLESGVRVIVYNRTKEKVEKLVEEYEASIKYHVSGIRYEKEKNKNILNTKYLIPNTIGELIPCDSISELVSKLERPRVVWIMVEYGKPVDEVIVQLLKEGIEKGDILIDGGNSFYKDSIRRYQLLENKGIHFLDVGTSGGLEGARNGACIMVGGEEQVFKKVEPLLRLLATEAGVAYFGPSGAGHFVKMVHNGIEYGMLQSIGEGFEILAKGPYKLDFKQVSNNWNHGSVVRGWLMELMSKAFTQDPTLEQIEGVIGGGSTGEWTVETAKELGVDVPVISESLAARKKSLDKPTFSGKVVAALRREFGGHKT